MKILYPFDQKMRVYLGSPQPWPIDPVGTASANAPVYAQLAVPAQSAADAPPDIPPGMLARRLPDDSGWELVADTLGTWHDASGQPVHIDSLSADVSALSREAPPDGTSMLVDGAWVPDPAKVAAAAKVSADAAVAAGMAEAARQIAVLQDAVDLGMATDAEAALYTDWRRYRVLISRVQSDPAYPDVTLPQQPARCCHEHSEMAQARR